jgi:ZIP family zinc transporter
MVAGFLVPLLAVLVTIAFCIHDIPEGVAISIPLRAMGDLNWRLAWWSVFSSLPQPIGAVLAFDLSRLAPEFRPFGFGFAAGAMIYLVLTEYIPEVPEAGAGFPDGAGCELVGYIVIGSAVMFPLAFP